MVVQARNFLEIPVFVRLGLEYSADFITFYMIRNWGTFTQAQFREEFIGTDSHPKYQEFVKSIRSRAFEPTCRKRGYLDSYSDKVARPSERLRNVDLRCTPMA